MLAALIGWLPVIGPIVSGVLSYLNKREDTAVIKYKTDAEVNMAAMQAANQLTIAFIGDIGVKVCRDIVLLPMSVWFAIGGWDKIMALRHPELVWGVAPFPVTGGLEYLPMACLAFLFGMAWKAMR